VGPLFSSSWADYLSSYIHLSQKFKNLSKSKENVIFVQNLVSDSVKNYQYSSSNQEQNDNFLSRVKELNEYIMSEYFTYKPTVLEVYYFPEKNNEVKVVNMIRRAKESLDIAIFTLTNDKIYAGIEEVYKRGIPVRLIADDEMAKCMGADVNKVALLGIPVKLDNSVKYHMHHKFCVIDHSIVITGSFNWTTQAVMHNQENVMFYENKEIARSYTEEFDKLWNSFTNVVTKEIALKNIEEEEHKKKEYQIKAQETRRIKKELKLKNV